MSREQGPEPAGQRPEGTGPTDPLADDDTEGHSLPFILGANAISRSAHDARRRDAADDELKPMTKTFPRLRDRRDR